MSSVISNIIISSEDFPKISLFQVNYKHAYCKKV